MKIALASDLHLEFGDINLVNTQGADVLILSGDILTAYVFGKSEDSPKYHAAQRYREFLDRCTTGFKNVVYVAGNHEFYHGKYTETLQLLRDLANEYHNLHFLECDTVDIHDHTFIGAALWTNMNRGCPVTSQVVENGLNDYRVITYDINGYRKLRAIDTFRIHNDTLGYFDKAIKERKNDKVVIVGHHAPSNMSTHPRYLNDHYMNGGYSSDLSEFILDHPEIVLWTHGHTHDPFDYTIGDTRIVCNPRGYIGHDPHADMFQLKFLDI
jgi:hypothetical protein